MTNDLLLSSDRGCISPLGLLDLSAAFDTIDHNILLNRLDNFVGIIGSALAWFKSYLSDRHQFVAVNEEVPQGSVLGPFYFSILSLMEFWFLAVVASGLLSWGHFISSDITDLIAQILFKLN